MLLTIDMGNTCITLGVFDGDELKVVARLATERARTDDQYAIDLRDILCLHGVQPQELDGAILCSVVPVLTGVICQAVRKITGLDTLVLGPGVKTGLNIKLDNPAQLGADLVAGAVAAVARFPLPCIIFDLGTATTIFAVDRHGDFLGGAIAPGIGISLDALATRTSQLPYVSLEAPRHAIGANTVESMRSGLVLGTACMMEGLAARMEEELGETATLVATGGRAPGIVAECKREIHLVDTLLLDGLRLIWQKNR